MSMPEFPPQNPDLTRDQALNMILSSIALEELALSHIINAEGEKIQYALHHAGGGGCPAPMADILAVNKSVTDLLEMVMQNQLLLKSKMEKVLGHLPKPSGTPCPVEVQCAPCPSQSGPSCFHAIPGCYACGYAVQWDPVSCNCHGGNAAHCERILLPTHGVRVARIALELSGLGAGERIVAMKFSVQGIGTDPVCHCVYGAVSRCQAVLSQELPLCVPSCKVPCYATLVVHSSDAIQLKQGYLSFY